MLFSMPIDSLAASGAIMADVWTDSKMPVVDNLGQEFLEIPAGKLDYDGEEPEKAAVRELREETGAIAENFFFLGELYPTPGYCGEIIWLYAATNLTFTELDLDEDEFLNEEKIPFNKCVEMILSGEIKDAKTQTAILKLKLLKDSGKI